MGRPLVSWWAIVCFGCGLLGCGHGHTFRGAQRDPAVQRRVVLGRSVGGLAITAVERGDPDSRVKLLVIGCIHGNEPAGVAIARHLEVGAAPTEAALWIVSALNPDGIAANTRVNRHGVDLNRNFPYRWRRLGRPGDQQYSGPAPLSEPEARIAHRLILRLRPSLTIWFHQPIGVVDQSGGSVAVERRFARLAGLALRQLPRYPGSAVGWQDHVIRRTTAFVVELPAGQVGARVSRYTRAVLGLAPVERRDERESSE